MGSRPLPHNEEGVSGQSKASWSAHHSQQQEQTLGANSGTVSYQEFVKQIYKLKSSDAEFMMQQVKQRRKSHAVPFCLFWWWLRHGVVGSVGMEASKDMLTQVPTHPSKRYGLERHIG